MEDVSAPPNPKVSLKRRKQVKVACGNCRKAKTACSDERPCKRCLSLGLGDSCKDVPRKRRGKKKVEGKAPRSFFFFLILSIN